MARTRAGWRPRAAMRSSGGLDERRETGRAWRPAHHGPRFGADRGGGRDAGPGDGRYPAGRCRAGRSRARPCGDRDQADAARLGRRRTARLDTRSSWTAGVSRSRSSRRLARPFASAPRVPAAWPGKRPAGRSCPDPRSHRVRRVSVGEVVEAGSAPPVDRGHEDGERGQRPLGRYQSLASASWPARRWNWEMSWW